MTLYNLSSVSLSSRLIFHSGSVEGGASAPVESSFSQTPRTVETSLSQSPDTSSWEGY